MSCQRDNWVAEVLTVIAVLAAIGLLVLCAPAFAGGADETLDPLNGCFAKADASADSPGREADFINRRGRYRIIADRYLSTTECWNRKANCIGVQVACYQSGKVVYEGKVKFWDGK